MRSRGAETRPARSASPAAASSGASALERRDGALGGADEIARAVPSSGESAATAGSRALGELGHVPKPFPRRSELVLAAGLEPVGVCRQRAQLLEARRGGGRVPGQLVVGAPGRLQLAPGPSRAPRVV